MTQLPVARNRLLELLFIGLLSVSVAGCESVISGEARKEAKENLAFVKVLEDPAAFHGAVVIWGGVIIRAVNRSSGSALFVRETPLDFRGRPKGMELSEGLFVARTSEFLEPRTYSSGSKVTITGEIIGEQLGKFRGTPYVYPVIRIKEIHPWKNEPAIKWDWANIPFYVPDEFSPDKDQNGLSDN